MKIILGIDIGGSTTKIIGLRNGGLISPIFVKANDAVTSMFGALGKFMSENSLRLPDVEKIFVTGAGSSFINENIYGIPTAKVAEFVSIGLGGLYLSGLDKAVIVSMGTGTAFIRAETGVGYKHLGGTGMGGGTLLGLSSALFNVRDYASLMEMAKDGDLNNIDLRIGDIMGTGLETLPAYATASNFGKISELATKNDLAMGLVNLVFEVIGMQAVFASRIDHIGDIILTGNLSKSPLVFKPFEQLMGMMPERFILPENAEFATALGAALADQDSGFYTDLEG